MKRGRADIGVGVGAVIVDSLTRVTRANLAHHLKKVSRALRNMQKD